MYSELLELLNSVVIIRNNLHRTTYGYRVCTNYYGVVSLHFTHTFGRIREYLGYILPY